MPTSAATVPLATCRTFPWACHPLITSSTATGPIAQVTYRRIRLMPSISSERTGA